MTEDRERPGRDDEREQAARRRLAARLRAAGDELREPAPPPPPRVLQDALREVRQAGGRAAAAPPRAPSAGASSAAVPSARARSAGVPSRALFALAAAVTALALVGGGVVLGRATAPTAATSLALGEPVDVRSAQPGVSADASVVDHTWGVEVRLDAVGLDPATAYTLVLLDDAGTAVGAGGLVGTGEMVARCRMTAPLLRETATGFRVLDPVGSEVLTADL